MTTNKNIYLDAPNFTFGANKLFYIYKKGNE